MQLVPVDVTLAETRLDVTIVRLQHDAAEALRKLIGSFTPEELQARGLTPLQSGLVVQLYRKLF